MGFQASLTMEFRCNLQCVRCMIEGTIRDSTPPVYYAMIPPRRGHILTLCFLYAFCNVSC